MTDVTLPDFKVIAKEIKGLDESQLAGWLAALFDQGRYLGRREGSDAWWVYQDADAYARDQD